MKNSPNQPITNINGALLNLIAGAFLISFSPVFVKLADIGPTMAGVYRVLFGGLALVIVALLRKETFWKGFRSFILPLIIGLIFSIDLTAWHRSIGYIGPGLSTLLGNFQIFILTGYGILVLHEKLTLRFRLSVPLAILGLVLIFGWDWSHFTIDYRLGFLLGLATAATYSAFTMTLRYTQSREDSLSPLVNLTIISFATAIFMAIFSLLQHESFVIPNIKSWASMLGYGLLCQALAWFLITRSLPSVRTSLVGLILLLQPTLSFIWDMALFKRPTTAWEIFGVVLALTAIYLGSANPATKKAEAGLQAKK